MKRLLFFIPFVSVVFLFIQFLYSHIPLPLSHQGILAQAAYPPPADALSSPSSPYPLPYPASQQESLDSTAVPIENPKFVTIAIDVGVEGLENDDIAEIRIIPESEKIASVLAELEVTLPGLTLGNDTPR